MLPSLGDVLARVAGVCRRDAGRRLADRRHAIDRRLAMNDPNQFERTTARSCRRPRRRRPAPPCRTFSALAVLLAMAYGGWKWWQVRQFELIAARRSREAWSARRSPNSS